MVYLFDKKLFFRAASEGFGAAVDTLTERTGDNQSVTSILEVW